MAREPKQEVKWKGNPRLEPFLVPVDDIVPNPENVRTHEQADVDATAASFDDHGQQNLVIVSPEEKILVAGEGRWLAAKKLGWTHVAALGTDITDEGERRLYSIRDNRTAELSRWDMQGLSEQLKYLNERYDLEGTGLWQQYEIRNRPIAQVEMLDLEELSAHQRNYREHPEDQIQELMESIKEHGLYRNLVVARDGTVLAGHGVAEAAGRLGITKLPGVKLDLDPDDPRALKVMASDNEVSHLGERDDRALTEMLREIHESVGLAGTGYDPMMLTNLAMVTRSKAELKDFDEAAEWVGMPEFEAAKEPEKLVVMFENDEDRRKFIDETKLRVMYRGKVASAWWPDRGRRDLASVLVDDGVGEEEARDE